MKATFSMQHELKISMSREEADLLEHALIDAIELECILQNTERCDAFKELQTEFVRAVRNAEAEEE
jgi:hypothetical protein